MTTEKQKELNIGLDSGDENRIRASLDGLNEVLRAREADASSLQLEIRREALWSIGKIAQNMAIHVITPELIISMLTDPDEEIRENAAWSLGELSGVHIGKEDAIEPLNRLLGDTNAQVRGMAAWALGRMAERMNLAHSSSVPLLNALLNDKSLSVSKGAVWALERLVPFESR